MKRNTKITFTLTAVAMLCLVAFAVENQPVHEEYQAQAMGQNTQMGKTFNVTIQIEEYSTLEDRQVLVDAFTASGSQGLFNALGKMKSKGHIAITGTLGYDISFVRKLPTADGFKIRVLTNRPVRFGELWTDSRSADYNLSAMELDISNEKGKSTGVFLPACQFQIDKKTNEVAIEDYQNPWKLVDILDRSQK